VDVSQQGGKVSHVVHGFRLESIPEEMAVATVFAIVIEHIATGYSLDGLAHAFASLTNQQMQMVRHQAIGIKNAIAPTRRSFVIVSETHSVESGDELEVVLLIVEYFLVVYSAHHDVVDTRSGFLT
jgi:hypothetical protein